AAPARRSQTRARGSRPRSAPRPRSADSNQPHWYEQATSFRMRIGVVTEAFGERPLDSVLDWLTEAVPTVKDLELASGGYARTPHCDREGLLRDAATRTRWLQEIEQAGFRIAALNAWGNPLDPNPQVGRE